MFFELGFSSVITQYVSHERTRLSYDGSIGFAGPAIGLKRFATAVRLASTWYTWGSLGCGCLLVLGGWFFFYGDSTSWRVPLLALVVAVPLSLYSQKLWSVYEGFWYVREIYQVRLIAAIFSSFLIVAVFLLGQGLLAPAVSPFVAFLASYLVRNSERNSFWRRIRQIEYERESSTKLFREILSLQSRISISSICGFFMFQSITPITYRVAGPDAAASIGIGMAAFLILSSLGSVLVHVRLPRLIQLINAGDISRYFAYGFSVARFSTISVFLLACMGVGLLLVLRSWNIDWAYSRLPDPISFTLFMAAAVLNQIVSVQATLTRSFKAEPYLMHSLIVACVTVVGAIMAATRSDPQLIALVFFFVTFCVSLPSSMLIYKLQKSRRTHLANNLHSNS